MVSLEDIEEKYADCRIMSTWEMDRLRAECSIERFRKITARRLETARENHKAKCQLQKVPT